MTAALRVGRDIPAGDYWQQRANTYNTRIDGPYHTHRIEVVDALLHLDQHQEGVCVDVGCGDGTISARAAHAGLHVLAYDPDPEMAAAATRRLRGTNATVATAGPEALHSLKPRSVDLLLAINVLAYFTDAEDADWYTEAARVVKPGGVMIVTHSNELFDLATLNAYTVRFHETHFGADIRSLLTRPDEPDRVTFNIRENPLAYRHKLARHGFHEAQQEFINLHPAPPSLMATAADDIDARDYPDTLGWPDDERWKLLFRCSMFGVRAIRGGA